MNGGKFCSALAVLAVSGLTAPMGGCGNAYTDAVDAAKSHVEADLFDPGSAKFRAIKPSHLTDHAPFVICGQVNAKNRFGGYVGFKRFVYKEDLQQTWVESVDDGFEMKWLGWCR